MDAVSNIPFCFSINLNANYYIIEKAQPTKHMCEISAVLTLIIERPPASLLSEVLSNIL